MTDLGRDLEHLPERPSWDCDTCGDPWPCTPAKDRLRAEYEGASVALIAYMSNHHLAAAEELPDATDDELYPRFLGWARATRLMGGAFRSLKR